MAQTLKFKDLYEQSITEVKETLTSMWAGGFPGEPNIYKEDLEKAIGEFFAPKTTMPVVQSMFPWEKVDQEKTEEAKKLVCWKENYPPYKHQYECWKKLLQDKKSICVTSGTGSGKTECFMLPVIKSIADSVNANDKTGIQAIFLYPLNALAEDQKKRLDGFLENVDPSIENDQKTENRLKFAVYNGNTPESSTDDGQGQNDSNEDGTEGTTDNGVTYKHELVSRTDIRKDKPEILVTNPTMLEYIMLRQKDKKLLHGDLKWFVIDETHSFKGAAAAELAMLIRRVLKAFNKKPEEVQFITSSATTGTGDTDKDLKKFIADLSWRKVNDIEIISGKRVLSEINYINDGTECVTPERQKEIAQKLTETNIDYFALDELITEGNSISEKLGILDCLCEKVGIKAKVHFFFQSPSMGLTARLNDINDGRFVIHNQYKSEDEDYPLVELVRCKKCGGIMARAKVMDKGDGTYTYQRNKKIDGDSFDIINEVEENESDDDSNDDGVVAEANSTGSVNKEKTWLFVPASGNNGTCGVLPGAKLQKEELGTENNTLKHTEDNCCPWCKNRIVKYQEKYKGNELRDDDANETYLVPLRVGSMFLSRILTRKFLDQMTPPPENPEKLPHNGQQFISFVDNRQAAARLTLDQAKDVEEQWFQSRVFKELSSSLGLTCEEENELNYYIQNSNHPRSIGDRIQKLELKRDKDYLTWDELYDKLEENYEGEIKLLVEQFLTEKEETKAENAERNKIRYIMNLMYEHLGSRKKGKDSLETLGMVRTWYPDLEKLNWDEICRQYFGAFNEKYCGNSIDDENWRNLVRMYIDYQLRSNANVYYRKNLPNGKFPPTESPWYSISIKDFRRFASVLDHRRPAHGLKRRFAKLLCAVTRFNQGEMTEEQQNDLEQVLRNIQKILVDSNILEDRTYYCYDKREKRWIRESEKEADRDEHAYRINLEKIAFKLYDHAYLCPTTHRPIPYTFMGFSPYIENNTPDKAPEIENWNRYDFSRKDENGVKLWWKENRSALGGISNRTARLFLPNIPLYVSAEHTAQIDKDVLKRHQKLFINHEINTLTCSTTMEMGVDLGDLELVVMNSIPPHPANYKQRAGRSGRRDQNKSVAITFCGNDSVGKQVMSDSMTNLIVRPFLTPKVDFESIQIIQRHVNSFLLSKQGAEIKDKVMDMFASFSDENIKNHEINKRIGNREIVLVDGTCKTPAFELGDETQSLYNTIKQNLIETNYSRYESEVESLLQGTPYAGWSKIFIANAKDQLERTYNELKETFDEYAKTWTERTKKLNIEDTNATKAMEDGYCRLINHRYIDLLRMPLLNYLSTHQFTPNAAMPVNIIEFDTQEDSRYSKKRRPSYTLSRALSQYAPGRLVVLKNACYRSSGVDWRNRFSGTNHGFKSVYEKSNGEIELSDQYMDNQPKANNSIIRRYNMISPTSFKSDINEGPSRITDDQIYTRTEVHLVNAGSWNKASSTKMIESRGPLPDRTPEMLFINTGKDNLGYCVCLHCGRAEIDTQDGTMPKSFLRKDKNNKPINNHLDISNPKKSFCPNDSLRHHVAFGDTIQTDYCELRLYHLKDNRIEKFTPKDGCENENNGNKDLKILHTLGMLICEYMSEGLGIERGEIDYIITSQGTLCIYDLAKGGAGYSKKLRDEDVLTICLDTIRKKLERDNFKSDDLINSFTVFNENFIDIGATKEWLEQEYAQRTEIPINVKKIDDGASYQNNFKVLLDEHLKENRGIILFADWNSVDGYQQFKEKNYTTWFKECTPDNVSLCLFNYDAKIVPPYDNLKQSEVNVNLVKSSRKNIVEGVYPIAQIGDRLYVTNNPESVQYNEYWGNSPIFSISANKVNIETEKFEVKYPQSMDKFILNQFLEIESGNLFNTLLDKTDVINPFITGHQGENLEVVYQDEHLKSPLGMLIAVQFIKQIIENCRPTDFSVKFEMEEYSIEKRATRYNDENSERNAFDAYLVDASMTYDMPDDVLRDLYLDRLCENLNWNYELISSPKKALPHWRVLSIKSGEDTLLIYPNGGLANGWFISNHNEKFFRAENLSVEDNVKVWLRNEPIMFDVQRIR